jgi:hypothetical protein
MSTLWFERHAGEVLGVEDNAAWCEQVRVRAKKAKVFLLEGQPYVDKIHEFPRGYFDLISIDGSHRLACLRLALEQASLGTILLVDNTDNDRTTRGDLYVVDGMLDELGPPWEVHRFPGWVPGNFFSSETTVCVRT